MDKEIPVAIEPLSPVIYTEITAYAMPAPVVREVEFDTVLDKQRKEREQARRAYLMRRSSIRKPYVADHATFNHKPLYVAVCNALAASALLLEMQP